MSHTPFNEDKGESLHLEAAKLAASDAIWLMGNVSAHISQPRCRKILKAVSFNIRGLVDEGIFKDAAPNMFGQGFETKMKE